MALLRGGDACPRTGERPSTENATARGSVAARALATDLQPDDENAYRFSEKMMSEPMMLVSAAGIFLVCAVVFEWEAVLDFIVALFSGG